ncbi:alpha/beta hydrolase family protein [Ningiella sp. W23]|uniref:alpha/beta hydrolase family protein n=1 Tax=Ningiella sp. W23 TaxID=3023715 RepID=UPI003757084B
MMLKPVFTLFKLITLFAMLIGISHAHSHKAQALYQDLPHEVLPDLSIEGELPIGVATHSITNENYRNPLTGELAPRNLTVEVWYPVQSKGENVTFYEDVTRNKNAFKIQATAYRDLPIIKSEAGKYPVVVLSHGYTGYRSIMFYMGEHLASHGYVVISIDHTDSTNKDVDFEKDAGSGFLSTLLNRSRDQQFALDWVKNASAYADHVSQSHAGVIGYSMGGYGVVSTIGGCYDFSAQNITAISGVTDEAVIAGMQGAINTCSAGRSETDSSWKASVLLAPWGGALPVFSPESMHKISVPSLYIAGDLDDISSYQGIRWMYEQHQSADTFLLTYENARHNIAPHPAPKEALSNEFDLGHYRDPVWDVETFNIMNKHFSLAMMDCYLKELQAQCEYLAISGTPNQEVVDGEKQEIWKGFDDRYATGMIFESKKSNDD